MRSNEPDMSDAVKIQFAKVHSDSIVILSIFVLLHRSITNQDSAHSRTDGCDADRTAYLRIFSISTSISNAFSFVNGRGMSKSSMRGFSIPSCFTTNAPAKYDFVIRAILH